MKTWMDALLSSFSAGLMALKDKLILPLYGPVALVNPLRMITSLPR